ncbi:MAG: RNA chaperone Hfq [Candidatus Hydrogenedentota bacterium]
MATAKPTQTQDLYLNRLRKERIPITAYLMNGVPLKGRVIAFDSFVVIFEVDGKQHMVFKHAISTIQPSRPVDLHVPETEEA